MLLVRPSCLSVFYGWKDGNIFYESNREEITPLLEQYVEKLSQIPSVEALCFTNVDDLPVNDNDNEFYFNRNDEKCELRTIYIPENWFQVFGIKLQEGTMPIPLDFSIAHAPCATILPPPRFAPKSWSATWNAKKRNTSVPLPD